MEQLIQTLELRLNNNRPRPMFTYASNGITILALYDSGAVLPVWCMREDKFLNAYPEAEKLNIPCDVSGFGKGSVPCSVYRIPEFKLNDGNTSYLIFNLVLAVYENPKIGCDIVLSDTMFSKTNTVIQRIGDKALRIEFEKDGYYCTPMINGKSIAITTWVQEGQ